MKFVDKKPPETIDASWFDKPSETTIIIGDGDPGFKIDLSKDGSKPALASRENRKSVISK